MVAKLPHLLFPVPAQAARTRPSAGGKRETAEEHRTQVRRIVPQLKRLQAAMEAQRISLQGNMLGIQPELALVLEIKGKLEDFFKAVKNVPGLEFLDELNVENQELSGDIPHSAMPAEPKLHRLYLVMTDERALQELVGLFDAWRRNPEKKFRRGLANWKKLFTLLTEIRTWNEKDRTADTGILENWKERLQSQQILPFEAELWFRQSPEKREKSSALVRAEVEGVGGNILQEKVLGEIAYHGILGTIPSHAALQTSKLQDIQLFKCGSIMLANPVGQLSLVAPAEEASALSEEQAIPTPPQHHKPVVGLLDGVPQIQHALLQNRLIFDDPDNFSELAPVLSRVHGTAMASLICHGDLEDPERGPSCNTPIYVRPILQNRATEAINVSEEILPENILTVDLMHRAVLRIFEGDNGQPPVAPTIRVLNISVGNKYMPYLRKISAWARLLDWLAWKYNVLFIVSAGNYLEKLILDDKVEDFENYDHDARVATIIRSLSKETYLRRILSPAESINCITVGAAHADKSSRRSGSQAIEPSSHCIIPSVYSTHGPGHLQAIKPDIFLPGGRQFLAPKPKGPNEKQVLRPHKSKVDLGQRAAAPSDSSTTKFSVGTSNAAALASRGAASLYEVLNFLRDEYDGSPGTEYDSVLLKALLVHGADWGDCYDFYNSVLNRESRKPLSKRYFRRFWGYGLANINKVMGCTDSRVTVLGFGSLHAEEAHIFQFPLPSALSMMRVARRFATTLAWFSPISCSTAKYRDAGLWLENGNGFVNERKGVGHYETQKGTVQHDVFVGNAPYEIAKGESLQLKVNCRPDAAPFSHTIKYALAATLEIAENTLLNIYDEVQQQLQLLIKAPSISQDPDLE